MHAQDEQLMARKKGAKFQGVVATFQLQLAQLLALVESSETHFVRCIKLAILILSLTVTFALAYNPRCIKPNMQKSATSWDSETVPL